MTTQTRQSACPLDCPDSCSLEIDVESADSDQQRLVKVRGSLRNPLTNGFICRKVAQIAASVDGPSRVQTPLRRIGPKGEGSFEAISWTDALQEIVERWKRDIETCGAESILPLSYGGSNGLLSQDTTDARLFDRLGSSRLARTVCAAPSTAASLGLYGRMPGVALRDYRHAKLIVVWGCNPSATGIHLVPIIREAQKNGARLVVIDPRRIPLAAKADLHLQPRPGTDLVIALALINWIFEHGHEDRQFLDQFCRGVDELRERARPWSLADAARLSGVDEGSLEELAKLYVSTSPAVIRCGWGTERNRNGGSAISAILALPAVAGKFGIRAGGFTMSNSGAFKLSSRDAALSTPASIRVINMNKVGKALLEADPPIRSLFVYNNNPWATLPNQSQVQQGLEREDLFTVVFDSALTDTARFADLVLPATTFLEHRDLAKGYGAMVVQRVEAVIEPRGQARSNFEVFLELCDLMGLSKPDDPRTETAAEKLILGQDHVDALDRKGIAEPEHGSEPIQFVDVFPGTADRLVDLFPEALDLEAEGLYRYREDPSPNALALISPSLRRLVSSTFGDRLDPSAVALEMNTADALQRGLSSGDSVRVWNESGEVICKLRVSDDIAPRVACLPKGLWSHHTINGATANQLVPDSLTDLAGGACFNDARVEVAHWAPAPETDDDRPVKNAG